MMCLLMRAKKEEFFFQRTSFSISEEQYAFRYVCIRDMYIFGCQEARPSSYADNMEYAKFRAVYLYVTVIQRVFNQLQKHQ